MYHLYIDGGQRSIIHSVDYDYDVDKQDICTGNTGWPRMNRDFFRCNIEYNICLFSDS